MAGIHKLAAGVGLTFRRQENNETFNFTFTVQTKGQVPKSGKYTYSVAFAEWNGKSNGATCKVVIKGDSIKVFHNGGNLTGKKGEILDQGVIMKHKKTGKYIIAHSKTDVDAPEINGLRRADNK